MSGSVEELMEKIAEAERQADRLWRKGEEAESRGWLITAARMWVALDARVINEEPL